MNTTQRIPLSGLHQVNKESFRAKEEEEEHEQNQGEQGEEEQQEES